VPLKKGSVLGGCLLIAGSCIGAGMLALPIVTGIGGFAPTVGMFFFSWLFMSSTALLLLEANLAVGYDLSLISIAERTLGKGGKIVCWILFIFLFYLLLVAYISASGEVLHTIIADLIGFEMAPWKGSLLFTFVFAVVLYIGTRPVDYLNRFLMIGLIGTYCALIFLGSFHVNPENLKIAYWKYSWVALPIMIISFGFHNMIPSLAMYLEGDKKRLRLTVIIGSLIPLVIYLLWEVIMLGIIPLYGREEFFHLEQKGVATEVFRQVVGRSWINTVAQTFALFAIITSFLAQALSLVDFLGDGLKIPKIKRGHLILVALTLVPPFVFALFYPGIFIQALNIGGGFSAVILFGVMPPLMVWQIRYRQKETRFALFPSNQVVLTLIIAIAVGIFFLELAQELGLSLLPKQVEVTP